MASDSLDTRTLLLLLVAALVLLPLLTMGMGSGMMGGPMMGGGTWGGGMWDGGTAPGWWLLVGLLGRVLTLLVVLGVGYLLYRALTESGGETDEAMETVRLAYARGDIDDEEYERRRKTLERDES